MSAGEVALEAPDVVTAGAPFEVTRTATINSNDFVAIAAPDAKDATLENYKRARDNLVVTLTAPAEPGLYELRYVLDQGRSVIARRAIEVSSGEVALEAPDVVTAGAPFEVSRTATINSNDFVAIAAPDAKDSALENYKRTRDSLVVTLTAPAEPGLYELRYVLDQGRSVIARRAIEVSAGEVSLEAPDVVTAGAPFEVSRTATINSNDFVAIAAPDAKDSALENYKRARDSLVVTLTAPAEPGLYELRYVLDQGRSVIARRAIEVAAASVELDAPATVTAGGEFEVARNTTVNVQDMLAMVPVGSADNELGQSKRVRDHNPLAMKAPDEPGLY
ncbi:MAG: hypothetical protein M5U09_13460 [Gammaproteobacteria bacterium]|nr:hypothetical protein [Gammaproteobacteria bacterium]